MFDETTPTSDEKTNPTPGEQLGEGGVKALQAERDARKQAEKTLNEARAAWETERGELIAKYTQATAAREQAEADLTRVRVLAAKGVPEHLAGYVQGATREELEASADKVLTDFTPAPVSETQEPLKPRPDMTQCDGTALPLNGDALTEALKNVLRSR